MAASTRTRPRAPGLTLRKHADKDPTQVRVNGLHPHTGEKTLIDPTTGEVAPWPLLGVSILDDPLLPVVTIPTSTVETGVLEGWIRLEGETVEHRPGGPEGFPWKKTHTFIHAEAIVFLTLNGEITYRVVHQPDKYHEGEPGTDAVGDPAARVDWFYIAELEG